MKNFLLFFLLISLILACKSKSGQNKISGNINTKTDNIQVTQKLITDNCVVFLMPDSQKLSKMRKEETEDNYNEIISDIQWYIGTATETLDSLRIKNEIVHDCVLIFKQKNGQVDRISSNTIDGNMILFRNDTTPKISFAINFNQDSTLTFFKK